MSKSNNSFLFCILTLIIVVLFLKYEGGLGKRIDLFSVSGRNRRVREHNNRDNNRHNYHHHDHHNWNDGFRDAGFGHRLFHTFYNNHSHPRDISMSAADYADQLLTKFDHTVHTKSGEERDLDKQELINAIKGDIELKFSSGDHYSFF
jgi:hypothetical protein